MFRGIPRISSKITLCRVLNYSFKHTAFAYGKILAQLRAVAKDMAQKIASCHPLAVRNAKQAVIRGLELSLADGLDLEKWLACEIPLVANKQRKQRT